MDTTYELPSKVVENTLCFSINFVVDCVGVDEYFYLLHEYQSYGVKNGFRVVVLRELKLLSVVKKGPQVVVLKELRL